MARYANHTINRHNEWINIDSPNMWMIACIEFMIAAQCTSSDCAVDENLVRNLICPCLCVCVCCCCCQSEFSLFTGRPTSHPNAHFFTDAVDSCIDDTIPSSVLIIYLYHPLRFHSSLTDSSQPHSPVSPLPWFGWHQHAEMTHTTIYTTSKHM